MTVQEFLKGYAAFAEDAGLTKYSIDQYRSYLNNVCKRLPAVASHLEHIAAASLADEKAAYAEQMNAAVTAAQKDDACTIGAKQLRNYKSAVALLIAYVSEMEWTKGKGASAKPVLCSVSEYDRKDLRRIFRSRVKTQDRLSYSYGVFAARILCRIAGRHKVALFNKAVDNVKFLISSDGKRFVRLKSVDKLSIAADGFVYVSAAGQTYSLYTEAVKGGKSAGYEKLRANTMRDLSLDHDMPLYHALERALDTMPAYKKLSDSVKGYQTRVGAPNASELSKNYWKDQYGRETIDENAVLREMGAFIDGTQMTVMFTPYNSSKSKSISAFPSAPVGTGSMGARNLLKEYSPEEIETLFD